MVSPEGGKPTLPWLATSWKWSNGNKTLTLQLAKGVKWSDGKPLTSVDVVYSLTAGKQNKVMDIIGFTRPDTNIASITAKGTYAVVINLKTADSQFIASTLNDAYRDPAAHLVEGRRPGDLHEPEPGRLRPVHQDHPVHARRTSSWARTRTTGRPASRSSPASSTCRQRRTTRPSH